MNTIDNLAINSIKFYPQMRSRRQIPAIRRSLGSAPMAYELWAHHMNHNPANRIGQTVTALSYPADMAPCCLYSCFTCLDTALQRKTL